MFQQQLLTLDPNEQTSVWCFLICGPRVQDCMLGKDMDISRLMVHTQQILDENVKEKERKSKREKYIVNCTQLKLDRGNHSQLLPKNSSISPYSTTAPVPKFRKDNQHGSIIFNSYGSMKNIRTNIFFKSVERTKRVSVCIVVVLILVCESKAEN